MPHPNKSQCPPHLRLPLSQGSDTSLLFRTRSMQDPPFLLSTSSVRRIGFPRCARPGATSIADIFVRSLVMAGYCHDHSPRGRRISTMSMKPTKSNPRNREYRAMGRSSKAFLSHSSPTSLSLRAENLRSHQLGARRIFNNSVAQRLEIYDTEDPQTEQTLPREPPHQTNVNNTHPNRADLFGNDVPLLPRRMTGSDQLPGDMVVHEDQNGSRPHDTGHERTHESPRGEEKYPNYRSPRAELFQYTSKIYEAALGGTLNWTKAVDLVVPIEPAFWGQDKETTAAEASSVRKLLDAIWDKGKSNHYIFTLYRDLPSPGVIHLSKRSRGALLRRFAQPRDRRWVDARRYLALLEDMLAAGLPVSRSLWTTAIHLAGRASGRVSKVDLIRAIGVWNRMEHQAGIESDSVVFTILFDIAIKSGQYTVADRLIEEMERRKIQFGRAGKVTKIHYYGMLEDPVAIRRAFDEYVESGEIVDTAVMNCLMVSFLKAGETRMAEQVYQRLLHTPATPNSDGIPTHIAGPNLMSDLVVYRNRNKKLGRVLELSARLKDSLPNHHRALQQALLVGPDTRTFHILLSHHAYKSGNLDSFVSIIEDMEKVFSVPPRGMIYLLLFDGFGRHGRKKKGWTAGKLRTVWKAYLRALYESKSRLHRRSYALPRSFVWENPLGDTNGTTTSNFTPLPATTSNNLYTPFPSPVASMRNLSFECHENRNMNSGGDKTGSHAEDVPHAHGDINSPHLAYKRTPAPAEGDDLELLEHRIENGVFLGRRMIIIILRAFGTCCGPEDLMEAWLRMESIWQPEKRKGLDVLAVKEELERQLERYRKSS
ncbi:pentatricopeptide repeat protein [Aspergillus lucknowensis]|uniref:Pentatricopeptide repeat protein n=1 Tax=Aspergillus lucknowensis TaxID=176173 RepID=A0ABR4LTQ4_9EURO